MTSSSASRATAIALDENALAASFDHCRSITRRRARNFYYGMMLTPQPKRSAMYAIYAWMRAVDDLGDDAGADERKQRQLETFRKQTHAALAGDNAAALDSRVEDAPMWPAVARTLREHRVPAVYLDAMIDGQLLDQRKTRYATFDELSDYCFKVAGVVGLICLQVWGFEGADATAKLGEQRGIALQLTNILRDLVEDARRDRVYLPADELAKVGFDAESFRQYVTDRADRRPADPAGSDERDRQFDALMAFQVERARGYYERSAALESHVTRACRPTCWAMMRIYERLLCKIARRPRRVLNERVRLSKIEKLLIALRATLRRGLRA